MAVLLFLFLINSIIPECKPAAAIGKVENKF